MGGGWWASNEGNPLLAGWWGAACAYLLDRSGDLLARHSPLPAQRAALHFEASCVDRKLSNSLKFETDESGLGRRGKKTECG